MHSPSHDFRTKEPRSCSDVLDTKTSRNEQLATVSRGSLWVSPTETSLSWSSPTGSEKGGRKWHHTWTLYVGAPLKLESLFLEIVNPAVAYDLSWDLSCSESDLHVWVLT